MSFELELRLYIAEGPNSAAALANLKLALDAHPDQVVRLEVIDVMADPERGLRDGVLMTPMLVKAAPLPERRVLGTLVNRKVLLVALGLPIGDA